MRESIHQSAAQGPTTQRSDILQAMALILSAATWLSDEGVEIHVDVTDDMRRSLPAAPIRSSHGPALVACLSPREREVAALMACGYSNRQIADELYISIATAERHASNIFNKLGVRTRTRVAVWAIEAGLALPQAG